MTGEATADTANETNDQTDDTSSADTATDTTDWKAEAEKFKGLHKKQEERAKANAAAAKELEQLRAASMSEQEKAVSAARAEARTETLREFGAKLVNAEIRAAAKGRVENVDALIERIDGSTFLDADGEPDRVAIAAWVDEIAPVHEEEPTTLSPFFPDLGQGNRGTDDKALNGNPLVQVLKAKVGAK